MPMIIPSSWVIHSSLKQNSFPYSSSANRVDIATIIDHYVALQTCFGLAIALHFMIDKCLYSELHHECYTFAEQLAVSIFSFKSLCKPFTNCARSISDPDWPCGLNAALPFLLKTTLLTRVPTRICAPYYD